VSCTTLARRRRQLRRSCSACRPRRPRTSHASAPTRSRRSRRSSRRRTRPARATPGPALPPSLALAASLTPRASLAHTGRADVPVIADLAAARLRCRRARAAKSVDGGIRGTAWAAQGQLRQADTRHVCGVWHPPVDAGGSGEGAGVRRVRRTLRGLPLGVLVDALGVLPTLARASHAYAMLLVCLVIERHGSVGRGLGLRFLAQMLVPGGSTCAPTEARPPAEPVSAGMNAYKDVRYALWRNQAKYANFRHGGLAHGDS
jgi:hypothetical protein